MVVVWPPNSFSWKSYRICFLGFVGNGLLSQSLFLRPSESVLFIIFLFYFLGFDFVMLIFPSPSWFVWESFLRGWFWWQGVVYECLIWLQMIDLNLKWFWSIGVLDLTFGGYSFIFPSDSSKIMTVN